jgi:cell division protein FtsB
MRSASAASTAVWIRRHGFTALLVGLIVLMQYPLWLGEGGWLAVRVGATRLQQQEALNQRLRERNDTLLAEVGDLKQGRDAIEERARTELGMIAPDEVFVRVVTALPGTASQVTPAPPVNDKSDFKHE